MSHVPITFSTFFSIFLQKSVLSHYNFEKHKDKDNLSGIFKFFKNFFGHAPTVVTLGLFYNCFITDYVLSDPVILFFFFGLLFDFAET